MSVQTLMGRVCVCVCAVRQQEQRRLLRRSSELQQEQVYLEDQDRKLSDTIRVRTLGVSVSLGTLRRLPGGCGSRQEAELVLPVAEVPGAAAAAAGGAEGRSGRAGAPHSPDPAHPAPLLQVAVSPWPGPGARPPAPRPQATPLQTRGPAPSAGGQPLASSQRLQCLRDSVVFFDLLGLSVAVRRGGGALEPVSCPAAAEGQALGPGKARQR